MKSIEQLKAEFKKDYPTLRSGSDEVGYNELSLEEYEATIQSWAENAYAKELKAQEAEAQAEAKAALLNRLGITADEAKLLLG